MNEDLIRFRKKLHKEGKCELYGTSGTGSFWLNGKDTSPRVAAWYIYKNRAPQGKLTTTCGTKGCVNIAHIVDTTSERGKRSKHLHYKVGDHNNKPLFVPILVALEGDKQHPYSLPALHSGCCKNCGGPKYYTICINGLCTFNPFRGYNEAYEGMNQ